MAFFSIFPWKMSQILALFVLTFFLNFLDHFSAASGAQWKCTPADKAEVDKLVAQVMTYGWEDRDYPETKGKLKTYCKKTTALLSQVDAYKTKCLKGEGKQIVSVFLYSTRANFAQYCKNTNSAKSGRLIALAPCANAASRQLRTCSEGFADILEGINGQTGLASKGKIPQICCGYQRVLRCVAKTAQETTACGSGDEERLVDFIKAYFENSVNTFCGSYGEASDRCDRVKLLSGGPGKGRAGKDRPPSLFSSLVTVLSNL